MNNLPYDSLHYDEVRQKASHNSYQRLEGIADQMIYWRLRCVELDIHNSNNGAGWPPLDEDWYIYHVSVVDQGSSVYRLSDALAVLQGFQRAVPDHEVATIALDLKDSFDSDHTPEGLDALLRKYLGDAIYTPGDMVGSSPDLQSAVKANGWPRLVDLRGKFIFICTTGDLSSPDSHLNQYVDNGATANQRAAFVAPEITKTAQISAKNYAVYFNMTASNAAALGPAVLKAGFVSRAYGVDSSGAWSTAVTAGIHLIASNAVNADQDPWARTDNSLGWPFEGIPAPVDPDTVEPGVILGLEVRSGDIWGSADSCGFVYSDCSAAPDNTYIYAVAVPGSHVNAWAKVGLMARSSLAAEAANLCMLRPAASNELRAQLRARDGASTSALSLSTAPGVSDSTWLYVQLRISDGGTTAEALASYDGTTWRSLARQSFSAPLVYQGLVASSHDTGRAIRFLTIPVQGPAFTAQAPIGAGASLTRFSGVYPPTADG